MVTNRTLKARLSRVEATQRPAPVDTGNLMQEVEAEAQRSDMLERSRRERRTHQLSLEELVKQQLGIVATLQQRYMAGVCAYPEEQIADLRGLLDTLYRTSPLYANKDRQKYFASDEATRHYRMRREAALTKAERLGGTHAETYRRGDLWRMDDPASMFPGRLNETGDRLLAEYLATIARNCIPLANDLRMDICIEASTSLPLDQDFWVRKGLAEAPDLDDEKAVSLAVDYGHTGCLYCSRSRMPEDTCCGLLRHDDRDGPHPVNLRRLYAQDEAEARAEPPH